MEIRVDALVGALTAPSNTISFAIIFLPYRSLLASLSGRSAEQAQFRDFLLKRYQNHRPDVIITVGPDPLEYMVGSLVVGRVSKSLFFPRTFQPILAPM